MPPKAAMLHNFGPARIGCSLHNASYHFRFLVDTIKSTLEERASVCLIARTKL